MHTASTTRTATFALFFCLISAPHPGNTAEYENSIVKIKLIARTPNQIAAFYEARGFPKKMIEATGKACFFTVVIKNKSNQILWHDLSGWKFSSNGALVERYDRGYWQQQWQDIQAPQASQSTFRWTLLPEKLDFRPNESEGGNITLPRVVKHFDIEATFKLETKPLTIHLKNIQCGNNPVS